MEIPEKTVIEGHITGKPEEAVALAIPEEVIMKTHSTEIPVKEATEGQATVIPRQWKDVQYKFLRYKSWKNMWWNFLGKQL